jgi:uncharacterized protein (TIGR03437 family)
MQPSLAGASNAFVAKLNPAGSALIYSTYLGGSANDAANGIAIDAAGNAYVAGATSSTNFPTMNPLQATLRGTGFTGFLSKLNAAGSALVYSTYLGGSGGDDILTIALDPSDNAYVAGETMSTDFPLVGPLQTTPTKTFVSKINPAGSALVYSTYFGGSAADRIQAIAADASGNAYLTGATASADFPTVNPIQGTFGGGPCFPQGPCYAYDAFVTKINPTGSALVYSTYLGGNNLDAGGGIAVDSSGNAYVAGQTSSANFPLVNPLQAASQYYPVAFVTKVNASGSALLYSTFFGNGLGQGPNLLGGVSIALDSAGNAYVSGITTTGSVPIVSAFQPVFGAVPSPFVGNAFVIKISSSNTAGAAVSPAVLTFAAQSLNTASAAQTVMLFSAGGSPLNLTVATTGDFAQTNNCGTSVAAGAACTINVTFTPTALGSRTGNLNLTDNASSGTQSVPLTGSGTNIVINAGGIVNAASFAAPSGAAGMIVSMFGANLAISAATASSTPLPTNLNGTTVSLSNGQAPILAPLFYVSPTQINFQVPWEFESEGGQLSVTVSVNGTASNTFTYVVSPYAPGIFANGIVLSNSDTLAEPAGSIAGRTSQPVARGQYISIYCTGLGPPRITPFPPDGTATPVGTLYYTANPVTVSIGGVTATPSFAGLAPGFVGLYQVDVLVPQSVTPGNTVPVTVAIAGVTSNAVTIAVQ